MAAIDTPTAKTIHGLDASRRAGWAKYFDARDEAAAANRDAIISLANEVQLCLRVQHHNRLPADDPLVVDAVALIALIESDPEGRRFVEKIRRTI